MVWIFALKNVFINNYLTSLKKYNYNSFRIFHRKNQISQMKNLIIIIISLFLNNVILSQEKAIKITHQTSKKEIIIKENKRIKVETNEGKKISGRFTIKDNLILINNQELALTDIYSVKRNPLLISALTSGFFIYGGILVAGFGAIVGAVIDTNALYALIPAAGMIYTGIKSPNFYKNYSNEKLWEFEIIEIFKNNSSK